MLNHAHLARADLNLLVVFDLLFQEKNSARVAARLNLTPSAISHALRRLRSTLEDPLFMPTSKGMVPTERAQALAPAIRDIVERVHSVLGESQPFDPTSAVRRFRIGAPDAAMSILIPRLVDQLERTAAGIDLAVIQILPRAGSTDGDHAWRDALIDLDAGRIDLAILPHSPTQVRFSSKALYMEDFVFASRCGHSIGRHPTMVALAAARHVLVSATGDTSGFVDQLMAEHGYQRRLALTVPNFSMAIAAIAASDLIGAVPRRFVVEAARNYDIDMAEPPIPMGAAHLNAVVSRAAALDAGIAWLLETVTSSVV